MNDDDVAKGSIAAVIGGGNGIGAATAMLLSERGWRVVVCDIDLATAQGVATQCNGHAQHMDVGDAEGVERAVASIEATHGPVEGVAMCAAIFQSRRSPEETTMEDWDRIVAVCLRGTYLVDVAFARRMAARGRGSIVNVSSFVAQRAARLHAYYAAKAGVDALTEGMAGEWGRSGIRVNAVAPGTTLVARVLDRLQSYHPERSTTLGRFVEPREVAQAIAFLLSPHASGITAANLTVDAGMSVAPNWELFGGLPESRSVSNT